MLIHRDLRVLRVKRVFRNLSCIEASEKNSSLPHDVPPSVRVDSREDKQPGAFKNERDRVEV